MIKILNINPERVNKNIFSSEKYKIENFSFPSIAFNSNDSSDFNIDSFISQKVLSEISKKDYDLIIMPVSLTSNFLELVGLRVAYHIRLTKSKDQCKPIIFLCDIGLKELLKLDNLSQILYSYGSYLSKTTEEEICSLLESGEVLPLIESDFGDFINKINFSAPDSYLSNHSIANEWGITRWSQVLDVDDSEIVNAKSNIENHLYFKWLLNKYPPSKTKIKNYQCNGSGKIVYIDDEWNKGWKTVLEKFFSFTSAIDFLVLEEVFKNKSSEDIEALVLRYIEQEDPDLIILDLRLADDDFNHSTLNEFTGYKILKKIELLNPGYQVIVFSATSKIWNLLDLYKEFNLNGFIFKESPDINVQNNYANKSIYKLKEDVERGLGNAQHRHIWRLMYKVIGTRKYKGGNYLSESKTMIEIAWDLILSGNLNYAFLTLYQAVEKYGDREWQYSNNSMIDNTGTVIKIIEITSQAPTYSSTSMLKHIPDRTGGYFKIENATLTQEEKISALIQVSAVCAFRLGKDDAYLQNIGVLNQLRNDIAHKGKQLSSYSEIEELLNLLYDIRNTNIQ